MSLVPHSARRRRALAAALVAILASGCVEAEPPVVWTASIDGPDLVSAGSVVRVRIDARPTGSWYFYSLTQPAGGPIPARIRLADSSAFTPAGPVSGPQPTTTFDNTFGINVEKYSDPASFILPVRAPSTARKARGEIRVGAIYQACNDTICLSPKEMTLTVPVRIAPR